MDAATGGKERGPGRKGLKGGGRGRGGGGGAGAEALCGSKQADGPAAIDRLERMHQDFGQTLKYRCRASPEVPEAPDSSGCRPQQTLPPPLPDSPAPSPIP